MTMIGVNLEEYRALIAERDRLREAAEALLWTIDNGVLVWQGAEYTALKELVAGE